jgi:hypothetical protein
MAAGFSQHIHLINRDWNSTRNARSPAAKDVFTAAFELSAHFLFRQAIPLAAGATLALPPGKAFAAFLAHKPYLLLCSQWLSLFKFGRCARGITIQPATTVANIVEFARGALLQVCLARTKLKNPQPAKGKIKPRRIIRINIAQSAGYISGKFQ